MSTAPPEPAQSAVPSSLLWAHILQRPRPPTAPPPRAELTPADKAKAATRILLHDTQSRLETFAKTAEGLLSESKRARVEVERVRAECAGAGEKVADEVVSAVNRAQVTIFKAMGEPAQAKDVETVAANVAGLAKLVDAQTHILAALQTTLGAIQKSMGTMVEQQSRAQDRHAQTLTALAPLLALPATIDALSIRVDRISLIPSSSPRSTTSSDPSSSSVGAHSSSSPKRVRDLAEPARESPIKRRKLDTSSTPRSHSTASSATRRDVEAIFPLPASAQRAHSRHSSVSSVRPHASSSSSKSAHHLAASSAGVHISAHTGAGAHTNVAIHSNLPMFETPQRVRASLPLPPSSVMRPPGSAIRPPSSSTRPPPSVTKAGSGLKPPPRAGSFLAPSSPIRARASSPLAYAAPRQPTPSLAAPSRSVLPTTRITPRLNLVGPGMPPARQPTSKPNTNTSLTLGQASFIGAPSIACDLTPSRTSPILRRQPDLEPIGSEAPNVNQMDYVDASEVEVEEPLMLIGSPVRPQDGRRWIDVGDSEDEEG